MYKLHFDNFLINEHDDDLYQYTAPMFNITIILKAELSVTGCVSYNALCEWDC